MLLVAIRQCKWRSGTAAQVCFRGTECVAARRESGKFERARCVRSRLRWSLSACCFKLYHCIANRLARRIENAALDGCAFQVLRRRLLRSCRHRPEHAREGDDRDPETPDPARPVNSGFRAGPRFVPTIHDGNRLCYLADSSRLSSSLPELGKRLHVCWTRLPRLRPAAQGDLPWIEEASSRRPAL